MSDRLSDDDVERIAGRVVGKVVLYMAIALAALMFLPAVLIGVTFAARGADLSGIAWLALALSITVPVVLIVWAWRHLRRTA
jgi:hypothetical protein